MPATERSAFWRWRHARPFWGGLFVLLGGGWILLTMKAPLPVVLHVGMTGLAGYLVPILLLLCGVLLIVSPGQRLFYSLVAAVLALGSWITSNLGGFVIGLLLALVGSALAFAWSPEKRRRTTPPPAPPHQSDAPPYQDDASAYRDDASPREDDAYPRQDDASPYQDDASDYQDASPRQDDAYPRQDDASPYQDDAFPRQEDIETTQDIDAIAPETSQGRPRHRRP